MALEWPCRHRYAGRHRAQCDSILRSHNPQRSTGNCVEVADLIAEDGTVRVRDSKDKAGPALTFSTDQ